MSAPNNKPQQSLDISPLSVPPRPTVASQHEWDLLSPEQQAAMLHAWEKFWLKPTPAVEGHSGSGIVIPEPPARVDTNGGKQPPTAEELESTRDWKKF